MNKKLLFSLSGMALSVAPIAAVVSCSSGSAAFGNVDQVTFNTQVKKITRANGSSIEANVYDPNNNENAIKTIQDYVDQLTVDALNRDFAVNPNRFAELDEKNVGVLTQFYQVLENETRDIEIEIQNITVKSKNADGSFQIAVTMEVERENRDRENLVTKEIKWTPKLTFMSEKDIESIKRYTRNFSSVETSDGQEIDLSDLKELFLGEQGELDDRGIFDILNDINKNNNNKLAQLVAYELTLNDLKPAFDQVLAPNARVVINADTKFLIPSVSLNTDSSVALVPSQKPQIEINAATTTATTQVLDEIIQQNPDPVDRLGQDGTVNPRFNEILTYFGNSSDPAIETVQSIQVIKDASTSKYILIIRYNNSKQMPDAFVITPSGQEEQKVTVTPTPKI